MRSTILSLLFVVSTLLLTACPSSNPVECRDISSCDLGPGGACVVAPSGNRWCAYPDGTCPSGQRYSDQSVGDGLAGTCVAEMIDAGIDAEMVDATDAPVDASIDGNGIADPFIIRHGTDLGDTGTSIAPLATGILVGGNIGAATNFGGGPVSGGHFVARFDFDGGHVWSKGFGSNGVTVATDSSGNAILGGNFTQPFTLGGSADTLTPVGVDGYVAKLSATNGAHVWSKKIGGADSDLVDAVATFPNGDVLVAGHFRGTINLGGSNLTSTGSALNSFVARLASLDGAHVWSVAITGTQENQAQVVAVDGNGDVLVSGFLRGTATIGGTNHSSNGESDGFVARLDGSSGARIWSMSFGGGGFDSALSLAPSSDGNVLVGGRFTASFSFGATALSNVALGDGLVAKLNGATGAAVWAFAFGGPSEDEVHGVADVGGQVVVGATFAQSTMFGGQSLNATAGTDMIVGRLNLSTGAAAGATRFGGSGADSISGMTSAGDGTHYVLTGAFQNTVDFGIASLTAMGTNSSDIVAGKLVP